ncbi:hypothetical protein S83_054695, partial [Arachis hypogaea]
HVVSPLVHSLITCVVACTIVFSIRRCLLAGSILCSSHDRKAKAHTDWTHRANK